MIWLLTSVCILALPLAAADWPQWRGPLRDGISKETGLLKRWPKDGPKLLWQVNDIGDGYATPIVAGSRLYMTGNRGMENEFVQSLSVSDGGSVWVTRIGDVGNPKQEPPYPMARSTPTLDGDALYALGSDGDLVCLEAATGKIRWSKSLRADFGGVPGKWAYAESPLIDGDALIATPGGAMATIVKLSKKDGSVMWKSAVPGGDPVAYASAIAIDAAGRKQYVQFLDKGVVGVDAETGRFLWRYTKTSGGPANIPTPVARNGYVYTTNSRRFGAGLVQLHAVADGVAAEEVYFERMAPNSLGGQVLLSDLLFGTNPEGLVCADFLTGKIRWQAESVGSGAVTYADGHIYVRGEKGEVALVEAIGAEYREKGRFTPPAQPKRVRAREMAWSYPVVANGRLYLRDLGTLWSFDIKAP